MSNVLRITTSTVGYDSQNTPPKSNMVTRPDTKVQAPVVPAQIVRPDAALGLRLAKSGCGAEIQISVQFRGLHRADESRRHCDGGLRTGAV